MRKLFFLLLFAAVPFLAGMGVFGEGPADKLPRTDKKYSAIFIDQMDVITECTDVSIDGNTFLEGKRGEGTLAVPFDKIKNVLFRQKNGELQAVIRLQDGNETRLAIKKDRKAYGKTRQGVYQIKLDNLKKMTFNHSAAGR
ncbi:MAG TPA: hypothetical protein PK587_03400 [Syntrophales bacterium]|nr:hypothetical protein [Syntrophales bacterium]